MAAAAAPVFMFEGNPDPVPSVKKRQERPSAVNELLDKDQFDEAMAQNRLYLPPNFLDHLCEDAKSFQKGEFRPGLDKELLEVLTFRNAKDKLVFYSLQQEESKKWDYVYWPLKKLKRLEMPFWDFYSPFIDLDEYPPDGVDADGEVADGEVADGVDADGVDASDEKVKDSFVSWKQSQKEYARQLKRVKTITPERVREMINTFIYKNMLEVPIIFVEMFTKIRKKLHQGYFKFAVRVGKDKNECCWYHGMGLTPVGFPRRFHNDEMDFEMLLNHFQKKQDKDARSSFKTLPFKDLKRMKDLKFYVWKEDVPWNGRNPVTSTFKDKDFSLFFQGITEYWGSLKLETTESQKADIYRFVTEFFEWRYHDSKLSKLRKGLRPNHIMTLDMYAKCYFKQYHSVVQQVIGDVPAELRGMIYPAQPLPTTKLERTTSYVNEIPTLPKRTQESVHGREPKRRRVGKTVKFT